MLCRLFLALRTLAFFIDCDLCFSKHIDDITRRAYQRTYMIHKGFVSRDKIMLSKSYITYVRPLLEYSTQIWSPTCVTDIVKVEKFRNISPEEFFLSLIYHSNSDLSV